jgi:hypothetical protein
VDHAGLSAEVPPILPRRHLLHAQKRQTSCGSPSSIEGVLQGRRLDLQLGARAAGEIGPAREPGAQRRAAQVHRQVAASEALRELHVGAGDVQNTRLVEAGPRYGSARIELLGRKHSRLHAAPNQKAGDAQDTETQETGETPTRRGRAHISGGTVGQEGATGKRCAPVGFRRRLFSVCRGRGKGQRGHEPSGKERVLPTARVCWTLANGTDLAKVIGLAPGGFMRFPSLMER